MSDCSTLNFPRLVRIILICVYISMIASGPQNEDSHHNSSSPSITASTNIGDELPSLSCDFSDLDITTNEFEQLLDSFGEAYDMHHMPLGMSAASFNLSQCDFASFFLEDTPRPRDLNLSFPGESNVSPLFKTAAGPSSSSVSSASSSVSYSSLVRSQEDSTLASGIRKDAILPSLSRPTSPAWSESSGSVTLSAAPTTSTTAERVTQLSQEGNSIPRHKRPSHKRAEIRRRGKIKTGLDDIKSHIPSISDSGKLSESTILTKAAEYIHQLKDGYTERGNKAAQLRREIKSLSMEIHAFQENLPAAGLKQENHPPASMDELYQQWTAARCQANSKFAIFNSLTAGLFKSFKEVVSPAATLDDLNAKTLVWQEQCVGLPVLRKQILAGMLNLTRTTRIIDITDPESLKIEISQNQS